MSFNISFLANQTVTDEDINNIGYNLSNTVYTSFTNDTLYGVDELNAITAHIMNKGVKRNFKNECSLNLTDGNVHINSGLAFFECGAVMTVDDEGIDVALEESTETQYVYLFFNSTINVGGARCTVEYPSGDFVMLGSVTDGVLKQDRTFAFLNSDVKGTNEVVTLILNPEIVNIGNNKVIRYRTGINVTGYKRAFCITPEEQIQPYYENSSLKDDLICVMLSYDIQNNKCLGYMAHLDEGGTGSSGTLFDYGYNTSYLENPIAYIEDGELVVDVAFYAKYISRFKNKNLIVELYGGVEE